MNHVDTKRIPRLTIPAAPLIPPGRDDPPPSEPLKPVDALDLTVLMQRLETSRLGTLALESGPWSVMAVEKPYTPTLQVMVLETGEERWLPGPERVPKGEGGRAVELAGACLAFMAAREEHRTIHAGWNWSPYSWGEAEEDSSGFQSIPTRWHIQVWGWPDFERPQPRVEWLDPAELGRHARRMLVENRYGRRFGRLIAQELDGVFRPGSAFMNLFPTAGWRCDARGFHARFSAPIGELFTRAAFSGWIKPLGRRLDKIIRRLTKAMTTMDCAAMRTWLKTPQARAAALPKLRAVPRARRLWNAHRAFERRGWPLPLLEALAEPVRMRCTETGDRDFWWRKGFGYALAVGSERGAAGGEMHILPGVYIDPGGAPEALGVSLERRSGETFDRAGLKERSEILWELSRHLAAATGARNERHGCFVPKN